MRNKLINPRCFLFVDKWKQKRKNCFIDLFTTILFCISNCIQESENKHHHLSFTLVSESIQILEKRDNKTSMNPYKSNDKWLVRQRKNIPSCCWSVVVQFFFILFFFSNTIIYFSKVLPNTHTQNPQKRLGFKLYKDR